MPASPPPKKPPYMDRPTSEYAQPGSHHPPSITDAPSEPSGHSAAATAHYPPDVRPTYTPQPEVRPSISASNTPQPEYGLNPPPARSPAYQEYLPRPQSYAPNSQPGGAPAMAQATSPLMPSSDSPRSRSQNSDAALPLDPSLPANSPTYPPPYSPYQPQGHEMNYQGHPPPPHQMYTRPDWPHGYAQHQHGMPGHYASPATTVGSSSPATSATSAGSHPGRVCFFNDPYGVSYQMTSHIVVF